MDDGMVPTAGQLIGCAVMFFLGGVGTAVTVLWLFGAL